MRHRTLFTRFEIPFPLRVIGIRFRPNFDVPPNGNVADFHQAFPSRCTVDILLAHREYPLPVLVEKLRERKSEVDPLSLEEVRALLSAAKGQEHAIFTTLILAGLRPSELLALRRQDVNFARGVIVVTRNLTRFGEGLPKTSYGEREVDMLAPVQAALAEQQARVERKSTLVFYERGGSPLSLKVLRRAWFRLLRVARLRERPLYQCRHTYATLLLSEGLNPLYVAHQMGHSTVAMIVRHYARWTRKPDRNDAERVERSLVAAGLFPPKMPEICQKMVDSGLRSAHSGSAQVRGIAREIGNAERWPSGRRHQIANLAYSSRGTEGSNPSLSAKIKGFLASRTIAGNFDPLPCRF